MLFCETDRVFEGLRASPVRIRRASYCLRVPYVIACFEFQGVARCERLHSLLGIGVGAPRTTSHTIPPRGTLVVQTHRHVKLRFLEVARESLIVGAIRIIALNLRSCIVLSTYIVVATSRLEVGADGAAARVLGLLCRTYVVLQRGSLLVLAHEIEV